MVGGRYAGGEIQFAGADRSILESEQNVAAQGRGEGRGAYSAEIVGRRRDRRAGADMERFDVAVGLKIDGNRSMLVHLRFEERRVGHAQLEFLYAVEAARVEQRRHVCKRETA